MFFNKKNSYQDQVVAPLTQVKRQLIFFLLIVIFLLTVPVFVFYASGYRYAFFDDTRTIISTGALYIFSTEDMATIFIEEQPVNDARMFRRASYVQHLTPGLHKVRVSAPNLHTWVKVLPVYPQIVTEVEAFLLPEIPQVRVITKYIATATKLALVEAEQQSFLLENTVTSEAMILSTSTVDNQLKLKKIVNPEYKLLEELFLTEATKAKSLLDRAIETTVETFSFQTKTNNAVVPTASSTQVLATTTKTTGNLSLYEKDDNIFVSYDGALKNIPYYFCVPQASLASTTAVYGEHVTKGIQKALAGIDNEPISETSNQRRICRQEIMIDRQGAEVYTFDFLNIGMEVVVLHRADGVFVTEIDDRSWQNTQRVYGPTTEAMVVDNNRVYLKDQQGFYVELLLSLLPSNN